MIEAILVVSMLSLFLSVYTALTRGPTVSTPSSDDIERAAKHAIKDEINRWWDGYYPHMGISKVQGAKKEMQEMINRELQLNSSQLNSKVVCLEKYLNVEYTPMWNAGPEYRKVKKGVKKSG